jgi:hypothetical protein
MMRLSQDPLPHTLTPTLLNLHHIFLFELRASHLLSRHSIT